MSDPNPFADELGIEKSTVDGHLTEAVKIIGARNRRDTALQRAEHDARVTKAADADAGIAPADGTPDTSGGHSERPSPIRAEPPPAAARDAMIVGPWGTAADTPYRHRPSGSPGPFRRTGQRGNDLSIGDRLIWAQAIALGIAIAFGMLMTGFQVLTGLIETVARYLS